MENTNLHTFDDGTQLRTYRHPMKWLAFVEDITDTIIGKGSTEEAAIANWFELKRDYELDQTLKDFGF